MYPLRGLLGYGLAGASWVAAWGLPWATAMFYQWQQPHSPTQTNVRHKEEKEAGT